MHTAGMEVRQSGGERERGKSAKLSGNRFSVQTLGPQNGGGQREGGAGAGLLSMCVSCWQQRGYGSRRRRRRRRENEAKK